MRWSRLRLLACLSFAMFVLTVAHFSPGNGLQLMISDAVPQTDHNLKGGFSATSTMETDILEYDFASDFSDGLAAVRIKGHYAFIDPKGSVVINVDPALDGVSPFVEDRSIVRATDLYGYLDRSGKIVVDPQYASASPYSEGLAAVRTGRAYGYLNQAGE